MFPNPIPPWNDKGLLPTPSLQAGQGGYPFITTLDQIVERFAHTTVRRQLVTNLLDYRRDLRDVGIVQGFQWINGSFVEDIGNLQNRSPADVDVVTFFDLPSGVSRQEIQGRNPLIFSRELIKARYDIDAFYVDLNYISRCELVEDTAYWMHLWSHTRTEQMKGFVEVDLDQSQDDTIVI